MRAPAPPHGDAGFSLAEVLLAVALLGICFAGLLGGMGMSVLASSLHRDQADGHALLVSAAEAAKDPVRNPWPAGSCPSTLSFTTGVPLPAGWTAAAIGPPSVEYGSWTGDAFAAHTDCTAVDLQRITLTVTSPDGRTSESLVVLRRRQ